MFKHTLVTKYPLWTKATTSVAFSESAENPFRMFDVAVETQRIETDVELARAQSLEQGGDGETFLSSWYFSSTPEKVAQLGVEVEITDTWGDQVTYRPRTVSGWKQLKLDHLHSTGTPAEEYSCEEVELDSSLVTQANQLEKYAQSSWSGYDPEPYCAAKWQEALSLCSTELEKEYVNSLSWM